MDNSQSTVLVELKIALIDAATGARFPMLGAKNIVGREDGNVTFPQNPRMSRRHFQITVANGRAWIEDLNSSNGTMVNGNPLAAGEKVAIFSGDSIVVGEQEFRFMGAARATVPAPSYGKPAYAAAQTETPSLSFAEAWAQFRQPRNWDWSVVTTVSILAVLVLQTFVLRLFRLGNVPNSGVVLAFVELFCFLAGIFASGFVQFLIAQRVKTSLKWVLLAPSCCVFFLVATILVGVSGTHSRIAQNEIVVTCRTKSARECYIEARDRKNHFKRLDAALKAEVREKIEEGRQPAANRNKVELAR